MISDEELKGFDSLSSERVFITAKALKELATELLKFREEKRQADMQQDGAWISGAKFGWNCGIANDQDQFTRCIESARALIVEERKRISTKEGCASIPFESTLEPRP